MSVATITAKYARAHGRYTALLKLGMVSPIPYKSRTSAQPLSYSKDNQENLWREFDRKPLTTGEESALGMPSAGGIDKSGGLMDGGYGVPDGPHAQGSFDASMEDRERNKRLSSAMAEAFKSNETLDQSTGPEPGVTQPHGGKFANTAMGLGAGIKPTGLNPPNPLKAPTAPKVPSVPKLTNVTDPRGNKPPFMNLQHSIQTNAYEGNVLQSNASPDIRFQGSPI